MKSILLLLTFLTIISCSKEERIVKEELIVKNWLVQVFDDNQNCITHDYLKFDTQNYSQQFTFAEDERYWFCGSPSGAIGGTTAVSSTVRTSARFPIPDSPVNIIPNFGIQVGDVYGFSNLTTTVTDFSDVVMDLTFQLPQSFNENLTIGSYKAIDYYDNISYGARVVINFEVIGDTTNFPVFYQLNVDMPYAINIRCIEDFDNGTRRVTGNIEGQFIGQLNFGTATATNTFNSGIQFSYLYNRN